MTDPYTFNHRLLRTQSLGVGMWLRRHAAPALGPHLPTRPPTDWSTPTCLRLNRLLTCSHRIGQGRRPRRGDRFERSASWERCGMGEDMRPLPISRPTPVVSLRRSPSGRADLVGRVSPRCHGTMSGLSGPGSDNIFPGFARCLRGWDAGERPSGFRAGRTRRQAVLDKGEGIWPSARRR